MIGKDKTDKPQEFLILYPFAEYGKHGFMVDRIKVMPDVGLERKACDGVGIRTLSLSLQVNLPFLDTFPRKCLNLARAALVPFFLLFAKVSNMNLLSKIGSMILQIA